jgi:DNA-binding beta-propeller fold protein YncE
LSLRSYEKLLLLAVASTAIACSGSEPSGSAEYSGIAYPDRRPSFELGEHRLGYVANRSSDSISVLDLDDMTLLGTVPVGRDPVDIDGPRHVQLDVENGLAYVVLSYPFSDKSPHALTEGEQQRFGYVQALNLTDLSVAGELRVDADADDVAFSAANGVLAVSHYDTFRSLNTDPALRRANLILVDDAKAIATSDATARRISLCVAPLATALNEDGTRAYVACTGEDAIAIVDTESGELLGNVPAGEAAVNKPYAIAVDSTRERLLTSNQVASTISIFELSDEPSLLSTLRVPGIPQHATWIADSTLAVALQEPSGAALFDADSGELLQQIVYTEADCQHAAEFSVTRDARVRLVCSGSFYSPGAVVEVDPTTLEILSSVSVGIYPERMTIFEP